MTEEIMPREDRMGKILSFIGGCIAGVIGVFTVAAVSELSDRASCSTSSSDSENGGAQRDEALVVSDSISS
jgi:hypothetical protein